MSRETLQHLNDNTLIGFTGKRGTAWHYRAALQGNQPNHYPGPVPVADVERRLFGWVAEPRRVAVEIPADIETATHLDNDGRPMRWQVQTDRQAMTRSDTHHVMGLFKDGYVGHQYREWLLGSVSHILGDTLHIGSAGLLRGGAVAWVSVEVPDTIATPEGVTFRPNLLACTSFDGSLSTTYKRVVTNTVCDNTMGSALAEHGQAYRVKHSRHSDLRLPEAREALAMVHDIQEEFAAQVAQLCEATVTDRQWHTFLDEIAPTTKPDGTPLSCRSLGMAQKKRDELQQLWAHDDRVSPWRRTAWGVVQADNTWRHHFQTSRGDSRPDRNMTRAITGETDRNDRDTLAALYRVLTASAA